MREWSYVIIIAILCLIFFSSVLVATNSLIHSNASDITHQYYPYLIFQKNCRNDGILCLWNPLMMGGFPWFGNPDSNLFYPPTSIFVMMFHPHLALNYLIIFHVLLSGLFMWMYLKEIKIPDKFALFGAISFMFSGSMMARVYAGHFSIINSIPWIPLIFLLIEKSAKSKSITIPTILGVVFAFQFFGSQPQIFVYTFLVAAAYFVFRQITNKSNYSEMIKKALVVILFFLGISAVQFLPSYEFLRLSVRGDGLPYDQITSSSLPPVQLVSLILPEFFGTSLDYTTWGASNFWELAGYIGILPIIFAFIAIFSKRDNLTVFFICLAIFSILYSFGKFNPLFRIVEFIPILDSFRIPSRFLLFFIFSVSVMSAIGLNRFLDSYHKMKGLSKILSITALIGISLYISAFVFEESILKFAETLAEKRLTEVVLEDAISPTVISLLENEGIQYFTKRILSHIVDNLAILNLSLVSIIIVYNLISKNIVSRELSFIFLMMILLLDLSSFGLKYISSKSISFENSLNLPEDTASYRIISPPEAYLIDQPELTRRNIQRFDGYYVAKLSYYDEFFEATKTNPRLLEIGNVKYIYVENATPNVSYSLPRAFFVYGNEIEETKKNQLEIMKQIDFDPAKILLLDTKIIKINEIVPLNIVSYKADSVEVEVNNRESGFIVLLDTWYPGWKAYADNEEKPVERAYYIMRGVEIDDRIGKLKFSFEPRLLTVGAFVTIVTSIFALLIVLAQREKYNLATSLKFNSR